MKKKLTVLGLSIAILSGCSSTPESKVGAYWSETHNQPIYKEMPNKKIYYNGISPDSDYAIAVTPSSNFKLGANPGIRNSVNVPSISSVPKIKSKDSFKKERLETLQRLCKDQYPEIGKKEIVITETKTVEVCSLDYTKDIPLRSIYFDSGSSYIHPSFYPTLDLVVDLMASNPYATLKIIGLTDNVGSMKVNNKVSSSRSTSVSNYLIEKGISSDRLILSSKAKSDYLLDNSRILNRAVNRRAELIFNFNLPK